MGRHTSDRVTKRRVFYIPGYDPIHPRRYRELYRKESTEQAAISDYSVALKPRPKAENYGWLVEGQIDDATVHTEVEVLVWSDIVRDSMSTTIPATYLQLVRTAWTYITTGALRRLMRLRKGPVIAALYPIGMLLSQLMLALLIAWGVSHGLAYLTRMVFSAVTDAHSAMLGGTAVAASTFLLSFVGVLRWFKAKDGKFFAYYLMHDYSYSAASRGANPPELDARIAQFAQAVTKALESDVDEVLVVGHSSGAHLGVQVLASLLRAGGASKDGPALSFLTLGQVVPMVSFLPDATALRRDLQFLSARDDITWVDVTAPGDGCAFALCDPVSVSGVAPPDKVWPLVFSAAFTQTLSPARWAELRWKFFRLHFQYLCAFDRPGDYDYFQITAGPQTLGARYADRAPSKSRIDHAVSKYTSVAP